jgi:polar amino acid transport system substrate-binding protein
VYRRSRALLALTAAVTGVAVLAACSSSKSSSGGSSSSGKGGGGTTASSPSAGVDSSAVALLPAAIKSKGTLTAGVDATYAPNEYKDSSDHIVGFDIDLFNAVAGALGLKVNYVSSNFDNIIPGITGGKYDVGVSSFTDNKEREKTVDFVTYYSAGIQFVAPKGSNFNPDAACGKKVAVQAATIELTDLQTRSAACKKSGKPSINIQQFTAQGDATTAVNLGKVDAMSADYPVSVDAVNKSGGNLKLVGTTNFDAAPYGYAIAKNSGLTKALQAAVQAVINNGTYDQIAKKWKLTGGEIKTAQINGAQS